MMLTCASENKSRKKNKKKIKRQSIMRFTSSILIGRRREKFAWKGNLLKEGKLLIKGYQLMLIGSSSNNKRAACWLITTRKDGK